MGGALQPPSSDILWGALLAAVVGLLGWGVAQAKASWDTARRLEDHIEECDKRQRWIMDKLNSMDNKLDMQGGRRGTRAWWHF